VSDLETERLRFRKFESGDLHNLASIRGDADVMRYIGSRRPEPVGEVQNVLNGILAHLLWP
jgi:RimJ/RimL family protein N-acetyltransferase